MESNNIVYYRSDIVQFIIIRQSNLVVYDLQIVDIQMIIVKKINARKYIRLRATIKYIK